MRRNLKAALCVAVALACPPATAQATLVTGIGDQNLPMFASPAFQELGVAHVRVVVPWDTAVTDDARAVGWIETALARGLIPLVAFEKSRGMVCPGDACAGPTEAVYEAAVRAFRARWPQITDLTPWNEPNHKSQPTRMDPAMAARYYNAARRACPDCRLVAGDLLDDQVMAHWLDMYEPALDERPAIWGLHNYFDATYFSTQGVDKLADSVGGEIWLTETGGIVRFSPEGGGGLAYDENRAADSIRWLYALTPSRPRVTRMYLYHWQSVPSSDFDGGLVGPEGQERPGLAVVREQLKPAPAPGGGQAPKGDQPKGTSAAVRVRISDKALRLGRRSLHVGVACVASPSRCAGRVVVTLPREASASAAAIRLATRFDLRPGRSVTRAIRVTAAQRARIARQRRLRVATCLESRRTCQTVHRQVRRARK